MCTIKITLKTTIIILLIVLSIIVADAILVGMVTELSSIFLVNSVLFTIGFTLVGTLVVIYIVMRHSHQTSYPRQFLGYGVDGTSPRVARTFKLVKEDEFI